MHGNTQKKQKTSDARKKRKLARATKAAFARKKRAPRKMRRALKARARRARARKKQVRAKYSMPDGICPAMCITSLEGEDSCGNDSGKVLTETESAAVLKKTSSPMLVYALVCIPVAIAVQVLVIASISTAPMPDWGKYLGYLGIDLSLLALVMSAWFPARMRKVVAITSACAVVIIAFIFCTFESAGYFG